MKHKNNLRDVLIILGVAYLLITAYEFYQFMMI